MGDVVNFNKYRKQKQRDEQKTRAMQNRALFSVRRTDKDLSKKVSDLNARMMDALKRDKTDEEIAAPAPVKD